jgi:hypothetical protein
MPRDQFTVERENENVAPRAPVRGKVLFKVLGLQVSLSGYIGFSLFPERHFPFLSNNSSWQSCHAELGKIPAGQPISKQGQDRLHLQVYNRTPIQACRLYQCIRIENGQATIAPRDYPSRSSQRRRIPRSTPAMLGWMCSRRRESFLRRLSRP